MPHRHTNHCGCRSLELNPLAKWLFEHNKKQSAIFNSPEAKIDRINHRGRHPTEILALKCMDGRLNLPLMTELPPGVIQPFRNIGGQFDLGWYPFQKELYEWMNYAYRKGRDCLVLVTYHFSKTNTQLGCKGFDYDTKAAREAAFRLARELRSSCTDSHEPLYAIVVGIETDSDTLILHGYDETPLSMLDCLSWSGEQLFSEMQKLFPCMSRRVIRDLLPLLEGNIRHTGRLEREPRAISDVFHKERILIVGRGVDWLHMPNLALIVGPFSYDLGTPVLRAGEILLDNLNSGRIKTEDGIVLLTSALHREETLRVEQKFAAQKAMSLAEMSFSLLKKKLPALAKHLCVIVGTTDMETRSFRNLTSQFHEKMSAKH